MALFSAQNDRLATPQDVALLVPKLNKTLVYQKKIKSWDHLDFIWGMDAERLIYKDIEHLLKKYHHRSV